MSLQFCIFKRCCFFKCLCTYVCLCTCRYMCVCEFVCDVCACLLHVFYNNIEGSRIRSKIFLLLLLNISKL